MKKCLVLLMVLGIASMATAGLTVTGAGTTADLTGVGNGAAGFAVYVGITDGAVGDITMLYTGDSADITDYSAASSFMGYMSYMAGDVLGVGAMVTFADTTGLTTDGLLAQVELAPGETVYALGLDMSVLGSYTAVVPEPMTMGLLGLGGLFLRRRK